MRRFPFGAGLADDPVHLGGYEVLSREDGIAGAVDMPPHRFFHHFGPIPSCHRLDLLLGNGRLAAWRTTASV
jgi:hypothetical protein